MLQRLRNWFSAQEMVPIDPSVSVDWAPIIYSYVKNLYGNHFNQKQQDRAEKEIEDRGLSFGQIKILRNFGSEIKFTVPECEVPIRPALEQVITSSPELKQKFKVEYDENWRELKVVCLSDPIESNFTGQAAGQKVLLSIRYGEVSVYGLEGLKLGLEAFALLGFKAGPKHYAHESSVKIEEIVTYAARWEDPATGARYLDVLYDARLVKRLIYIGSVRRQDRSEDELTGVVMACPRQMTNTWWPKMTMNNRPVYSTVLDVPTAAMLAAKAQFATESIYNCACGKLATRSLHRTTIDFGDASLGSIAYCCDDAECEKKAQEGKWVRISISPYTPEVW